MKYKEMHDKIDDKLEHYCEKTDVQNQIKTGDIL